LRAVVQRVSRAAVRVEDQTTGEIANGLCVLLGVGADDDENDAAAMAGKIAGLRIFSDTAGLMNLDVTEAAGSILLISQFTVHGDARKGRRPSFINAAREEVAKPLYERVGQLLERQQIPVAYGVFGARMSVELVNEGPVTILLDTKKMF
jgi:D-aminoacyl-tRNA deacylase